MLSGHNLTFDCFHLAVVPFMIFYPSSTPGQSPDSATITASSARARAHTQLFWPMISGALWGWGSLFLASTSSALRGALYPPSHARKGRITGGPGGKISQAGGGEAVGGSWWNKFVKSWGGAVQTASV